MKPSVSSPTDQSPGRRCGSGGVGSASAVGAGL